VRLLAGNIGPVADALLDFLGTPLTIACPAFPTNKRTIYQGHLFVGDQLLSDSPMKDDEIAKAKGPVMHFPTVLGAVAVTYNIPGVTGGLKLSGPVLADIFAGRITKWNDAKIGAMNAGAKLPATDVLVVHRSDGSGTTFVFTDYLATVSPAWASGPGRGKEVSWPVGLGGKGNDGVAGQVKQTPGAIGYVELAYAKQNSLPYASIRNARVARSTPADGSMTWRRNPGKLPGPALPASTRVVVPPSRATVAASTPIEVPPQ